MAKTAISIAAQNTFTTEMNCPRDSVLVDLDAARAHVVREFPCIKE